jgi:hypothetical protein
MDWPAGEVLTFPHRKVMGSIRFHGAPTRATGNDACVPTRDLLAAMLSSRAASRPALRSRRIGTDRYQIGRSVLSDRYDRYHVSHCDVSPLAVG